MMASIQSPPIYLRVDQLAAGHLVRFEGRMWAAHEVLTVEGDSPIGVVVIAEHAGAGRRALPFAHRSDVVWAVVS